MNREDEKKNPAADQQSTTSPQNNNRNEDDDQHSYPGKLDQVEGDMHNGEIGGGLKKEEEANRMDS